VIVGDSQKVFVDSSNTSHMTHSYLANGNSFGGGSKLYVV
jgi:hypothetical protein